MRIAEITADALAEVNDKELLSLHRRCHQLAGSLFATARERAEDDDEGKLTWEDLVNAHALIAAEMEARDMNHNVRDRLDRESARVEKGAVSLEYLKARLAEAQDIVVVENFISIAGSVVQKGERAGDVDLVIRQDRRDPGLEILTRKVFDPEKRGYLHWIYQESGPHADYVPAFDLVLRPKKEFKVHTVKARLRPVTRYTPSKPAMIGYTEFFSADELWEKWASEQDVPLYVSPKVDGFRCIMQKAGDRVSIYFEDSKEERGDELPALTAALGKASDCIIEGELQAARDGRFLARPQVFSVIAGKLEATLYVFLYDLLYVDPEGDVHDRPFSERYELLKSLGEKLGENFVVLPQRLVKGEGEFKRAAKEMASWQPFRGAGLAIEGVVARRSDMPYTFAATDDYAKFKTWCELKVKVLKVEKTANGYVYECALRDDGTGEDVVLGRTFVSKERLASEGDTLNVMIEELLLYPDGKVAWGKPYPMGPDRSRPAYTVAQAIDIARRGKVLKVIHEGIANKASGTDEERVEASYVRRLRAAGYEVGDGHSVHKVGDSDKGSIYRVNDGYGEWYFLAASERVHFLAVKMADVQAFSAGRLLKGVLTQERVKELGWDTEAWDRALLKWLRGDIAAGAAQGDADAVEKALSKPFSSPGGKDAWVGLLLAKIPVHKVYVEPYAGGASLFWAKEPSEKEVLADIDADVVAVYRFLKTGTDEDFEWMRKQKWEWSPSHFEQLKKSRPGNLREQAYRWKYLNLFSVRGDGEEIVRSDRARHYTAKVFLGNLERYRERLRNVTILQRDALAVMKAYDSPDTFFYLDPPWKPVGTGEEWRDFDETAFAEAVLALKGKVLISYQGDLPLPDWHKRSFTRAGGGIAEDSKQTLYWNYEVRKATADKAAPADEGETRGERAEKLWQENWYRLYPKSGKGRFVLHEHWRGLSEDEVDLPREELIRRGHSLHSDLRLESNGTLHGWTVFLGKAEDNATNRLITLPPDDNLQVAPKLVQPKGWLTFEGVSEPGEVGATTGKYARFDIIDSGTYEAGVWREHMMEYVFHGKKLKGRLLVQYAPLGGRRVWIIDKPEDQRPYAETHDLEGVVRELKDKGQKWLIWRKPGEKPRLIDVGAFEFKKASACRIVPIAKVDSARQIVYGIVLDPYIVDSQGDWVPVLEVEKAAHRYLVKSRIIGDQHKKKADAELVESWLVPYPTPEDYRKAIAGESHKVYQFKFGDSEVHSGAWVVGIHVLSKRLWDGVVSGAKTGLSIGAVGERTRNAAEALPEFETVEPEKIPAFVSAG
ncbi:MAG: XkdF-like putative serine protease domain-containing protein [Bacillota bacterium]